MNNIYKIRILGSTEIDHQLDLKKEKYFRKYKNLSCKRFGRLVALDITYINNKVRWECLCDCGNITYVETNKLGKDTNSCGCIKKEGNCKRHGLHNTKFYNTWIRMKNRCFNKNSPSYRFYGKIGISVCNEWLDFNKFKDDMYKDYLIHIDKFGKIDTSIDRIDNDKGYCLENCRWATMKEQSNNRGNNIRVNYKNKEYTLKLLAEKLKMNYKTLWTRMNIGGLNLNEAINKK